MNGKLGWSWLIVGLLAFGAGWWWAGGSSGDASTHDHDHAGEETYTCSMHPQVRQPGPGDCPICGMALIPAGEADDGDDEPMVRLSERARALSRLRTERVEAGGGVHEVRLTGRVEVAEDRLASVIAWAGGRVERLRVRRTGDEVRRGQVVAEVFSPELLSAHGELRAALVQLSRSEGGGFAARARDAARERLRLLGVPEDELAALEEHEGPLRSVPLRSPFSGTVLERLVTEGDDIAPGQAVLRLGDLRAVWAVLDAYPEDLTGLEEGIAAQVEVDGVPGSRPGRVTRIEPVVDGQRQVGRVRVLLDNADGQLRPGLLVRAKLDERIDDEGLGHWVPHSAVYQTGRRAVVFVEVLGDDRPGYVAREVRVGPRVGDRVGILSGLGVGERVVVHGAFVIDADLQLRGARSLLTLPDHADPYAGALPIGPAERGRLAPVVDAYLAAQRALADDDLDRARAGAHALREGLERPAFDGEAAKVWEGLASALRDAAEAMKGADDLAGARDAFGSWTEATRELLERFGNPLDASLHLAFCPMSGDDGAYWVQQGTTIDNAYQGERMRRCGEVRGTVSPDAVLRSDR